VAIQTIKRTIYDYSKRRASFRRVVDNERSQNRQGVIPDGFGSGAAILILSTVCIESEPRQALFTLPVCPTAA
jgi:hypothetical protein